MKNLIHYSTFLLIFLFISNSVYSQQDAKQKGLQSINENAVKAQLEFLASDWTEGRATGEKGAFLAADYLASMLQFMNVKAAGDQEMTNPTREEYFKGVRPQEYTSYFQNIYMSKNLESNTAMTIKLSNQELTFNEGSDFLVSSYPHATKITAEIVFVGYGFIDEENNYDDFKGVDVKNKIIIRMAGYPGHKDVSSKAYKTFHKNDRYFNYYLSRNKNKHALEQGAVGVIEISEENI
ncbi:MAG: hypothetical protein R6V23_04135, partial [Bacteroidales bacterium]